MRREFVGAFCACLQHKRLEEITLKDVARQLKVSGPALYRYFKTREELVELAANQTLCALSDSVFSSLRASSGQDFRERHRTLWKTLMEFVWPRPGITGLLLRADADERVEAFQGIYSAVLTFTPEAGLRISGGFLLSALFFQAAAADWEAARVEALAWPAVRAVTAQRVDSSIPPSLEVFYEVVAENSPPRER